MTASTNRPNVLILGAGAVGQVFGYHLHKGGAKVSFRVRPKYVEEVKQGFDFYELKIGKKPNGPEHWDDFGVFGTDDEVAGHEWDQVWLCISSAGLQGAWLEPFLAACGSTSTIVALPPGPKDRQTVAALVDPSRIVHGLISFVAYQAPLPGEDFPPKPSMAYWLPPLSPCPFGGEELGRIESIVSLLGKGGMGAKSKHGEVDKTAFGATLLNSFLMALEVNDWSLSELRCSPDVKLASKGMKEAAQVMAKRIGLDAPGALKNQRPFMLNAILGAAPHIVPFNLEVYLKYHFTKVGEQTRRTISIYLDWAKELGVPTPALQQLYDQLMAYDKEHGQFGGAR